jgi:hypothetical protein
MDEKQIALPLFDEKRSIEVQKAETHQDDCNPWKNKVDWTDVGAIVVLTVYGAIMVGFSKFIENDGRIRKESDRLAVSTSIGLL